MKWICFAVFRYLEIRRILNDFGKEKEKRVWVDTTGTVRTASIADDVLGFSIWQAAVNILAAGTATTCHMKAGMKPDRECLARTAAC